VLIVANTGKLTFQSPELWVYLLGLTVLLGIALRRVLAQQNPLKDEVYMKNVAIEYVQSGVAWIRADGTVRSINQSLADTLGALPRELIKLEWYELFAAQDHAQLKEAFSQMLLIGKTTLQVHGKRMDGTYAGLELLMVAIHDHKMRFVGHHCLVVDRTRERVLEAQIAGLKQSVLRPQSAAH
jgi:PAS domain S-box-containing protein